jgi:hypothetical protein
MVLLALVALAVGCAGSAAASTVGVARIVSVGSSPVAVAVGDVNGDGRNDVVVTTGYANDPARDFRLWVLTQRPDGSLAAPLSYVTAGSYVNRPESVAVGDVTGDGKDDVVVGLGGLGVQVFAQSGGVLATPTFTPTVDSGKIRLGRLDGDADLDVAGVGWGTNTVTVLLNDGRGHFPTAAVYPAQHGGYEDLEVGDVTGDGRSDIVVMSGQLYSVPNVSVLTQSAAGFAAAAEYRVAANVNTQGIGIGDVTGDGRADVVASYGGNQPNASIAVFAQTSSGTLAAPVRYASYDIPEPVEVVDVDRDGRADIVTAHGGWQRAGIYLQGPGGTLGPEELAEIPYVSHYNPHGLAVGDIDGNGSPDIVIADSNNGLVILPGTATAAANADRAVTLVSSASTVKQRKPFTLDIKVANAGPATTAATAVLTLSGSFTAINAGPGCVASAAKVTCTYASLAAGDTATSRLTVTAAGRGTIAASATVTGDLTDPNPANNTSSTTITVG